MGFKVRCNAEPFLFLFSAVRSWHTHYSSGFMVWLTAGSVINVCGKQKRWTLKQYHLENETETSVTTLKVAPAGIAEVILAEKPCLALSYR